MNRLFRQVTCWIWLATALAAQSAPIDLTEHFELPPGFHIYRAANRELTGGSYALTFDGEGRLMVGDGNAVRRLADLDGDGVFDSFEVIATGLGSRGPQGLLVYGDRLYAVGGDGLQLFEGYGSAAPLTHRGRLGNPFGTGGDHDAHTIFRGRDGWLYFMAGNGAGTKDRVHITEESSPCRFEREASVFRINPDGTKWECIAVGGRNPPNLGENFLGDFFSFDSDMEWHVGLPWYRPVRLNHWAIGGDQGWQEVGAYPPYYLDALPGMLNVGRGSPTWGTFYEHIQLPEKYRDAFLVCDYRWKNESNDKYSTTGRLVAFFLTRIGAGWKATMEILAKPKPGSRDTEGKPIDFALVDCTVAPDGSLFLSDHNQGVWRIFYDGLKEKFFTTPKIVPGWAALPATKESILGELLTLPQPASEHTRLREEQLKSALGADWLEGLQNFAKDETNPLRRRLCALQLVAPQFATLPRDSVERYAKDRAWELRSWAAWLVGIRGRDAELPAVIKLLDDEDAFVRRRAAESLTRLRSSEAIGKLIEHLDDSSELVRHVCMAALEHYPNSAWLDRALAQPSPQIRMRALAATVLRRELPPDEKVRGAVRSLLDRGVTDGKREDQLAFLRLLALFQRQVEDDAQLRQAVNDRLLANFPHTDHDIRWEQIRFFGAYRFSASFPKLLAVLESERNPVTQFHLAQSLARLRSGWNAGEETRLLDWFLSTQTGWFADLPSKGVEFPAFWQSTLADFAANHRAAFLRAQARVNLSSLLGNTLIQLLANSPDAEAVLLGLYRSHEQREVRIKLIKAAKSKPSSTTASFLRSEFAAATDGRLRGAILQALAAQNPDPADRPLFIAGLQHNDAGVARACAVALTVLKPRLDEPLAQSLIELIRARRDLVRATERLLVTTSNSQRSGYDAAAPIERRVDETERAAAFAFWKDWYHQRFGKEFLSAAEAAGAERSDEELHRFILGDASRGGGASKGGAIYERLQCHTCHGGTVLPGGESRIFGPDLAGVTRRLPRAELADALVYPSKQVADRFKAMEVALKDNTSFTGFITEQNDDFVTVAEREQVRRIPRKQVEKISSQTISLMPERLLAHLTDEEIRDLLAYLENLGTEAPK
jgi:putative heme-binding domain-containing protein